MTFYLIILLGILHRQGVHSYESGSAESNKVEITPYYDTIIFGDVADILNEFENANSPLEAIITSGSAESDENMEDLLSEYQVYLDKAHKQKMDYIEKNRLNSGTKNKVPLIRHERFSKNKPGVGVKYDDVYYNAGYYNPTIQQSVYTNPIDLFLPSSQKITKFLRPEFSPSKEINEQVSYDKKINGFPMSSVAQRSEPGKPMGKKPCKMCMMSHGPTAPAFMLPADGDGKTSAPNSEYMGEDNTLNIRIKVDIQLPKAQDNYGRTVKNRSREEDINSKEVSVNVPFPYFDFPIPMNIFGYKRSPSSKYNKHDLGHHKKNKSRTSNKKHKKKVKVTWADSPQLIDIAAIPYRLDEKNFTDIPKKDNDSYQKAYPNEQSVMYLEKSESRTNNETQGTTSANEPDVRKNETQTEKNIYVTVNISSTNDNITEESHKENSVETDLTTTNSNVVTKKDKSQVLQRVRRDVIQQLTTNPIMATNISSNKAKQDDLVVSSVKPAAANYSSKIEKQVDTVLSSGKSSGKNNETTIIYSSQTDKQVDIVVPSSENNKTTSNKTVEQVGADVPYRKLSDLRYKSGFVIPLIIQERNIFTRSIPFNKILLASSNNTSKETKSYRNIAQELKLAKDVKKSEKVLATDKELAYWPESIQNITSVESVSQNIDAIILEREHKKGKLNMTNEAIRDNHTTALEKAIFGDVNWDDVDTVAPVFMSFVGKYINGMLTFCSQDKCHSMRCSDKSCVHRTCEPKQRWNQRGHCAGSKKSDSVAFFESLMDLPSNVAFEIVDILQEKMLGKIYGSVTLCITSKCVSFVTSKRNFLKSKCSVKELNTNGQCPTAKKNKFM